MARVMLASDHVPRDKLRHAIRLVGESSREIGVLIMVFAHLDPFFQGVSLTTRFVVGTMALSACLIVAGILMEVGSS